MAWSVYALLNETRKEIYVALTDKDVETAVDLDHAVPPEPVRHWQFGKDRIRFDTLSQGLSRHDARVFERGYLSQPARPGWSLHRGSDLR